MRAPIVLAPLTGDPTYDLVFAMAMAAAGLVALAAGFVDSPYGRFGAQGFGPAVSPRVGWVLMELPAVLAFVGFHAAGERATEPVPLMFLGLWLVHYLNRGLLFPLRLRVREGAGFSWLVVAFGWAVTTVHGYLNGAWVGGLGSHLTPAWLTDPRFLSGIVVYIGGFALNVLSDATLRDLRARPVVSDHDGYRIPRGGAFRYVSCPNYLGELIAWTGFALATGSPGGVFILAITSANLVPRALRTHRWYQERFPDYPPGRRALVPFVL